MAVDDPMSVGGVDAGTLPASPLFAERSGLSPLPGQAGVFDGDAANVGSRMGAAGIAAFLEGRAGLAHVRQTFHPALNEGRDAIARIGAFLRGRLQ